ncbi:MAG: putative pyruvate formate lyase activating enzyme [Candidatus Methanomethylophilaceae archaeon]|nr:putative pyruvate formate lyase activating enzyme [Candidatus Methanomethylophilaceae archaeon]MDI3541480.1 putative pyruvate formate lyase activating enzyme [Candidatus Methanomethylophilaceae archaeon]
MVYNSGGYDSVGALRLLDGVVDIYMPDAKYGNDEIAGKLSHVKSYTAVLYSALKEMHRQVGDLMIEKDIAVRGLLVRHLVLPGGLAGSEEVMRIISAISKDTYVNIMAQYRPEHKASISEYEELRRPVYREEVERVKDIARRFGLHRGF